MNRRFESLFTYQDEKNLVFIKIYYKQIYIYYIISRKYHRVKLSLKPKCLCIRDIEAILEVHATSTTALGALLVEYTSRVALIFSIVYSRY